MSEADKMLLKEGYKLKYEDEYEIKYEYHSRELGDSFYFILCFCKKAKIYFHKDIDCNSIGVNIGLHKAINKKCEELRMDLKKEWKEIKGYEGKYIISNYGEIISLPRYKENRGKFQYVEPKEICRYVNKNNGYVYVQLWNDAKYKNIRLHKLVAETFIPNNENKSQINHIDGDKQNNKIDNLEWCTASENIRHAYKTGLRKIKRGG